MASSSNQLNPFDSAAGLLPRLHELRPRLPQWPSGAIALMAALLCGAVGLELAWHYPLSGPVAVALWLAVALMSAVAWVQTPLIVLAPLAVCGLAPLTGWITFEEMDLLVTAVVSGGNLGFAFGLGPRERAPAWRQGLAYPAATSALIVLLAASALHGLWRGVQDAGGWQFGWFQGYHEPMNAVRNSKAIFLALLLLPLWVEAARMQPRRFTRALRGGLVLALVAAALAALWERAAYTALLDFSSDYRTTGSFWEMHVGGAALDGFLVMTLPFAVLTLLRTRSPAYFVGMLGVVLLAAYACLTTFSRGVYLALPLALAPMLLLADAQRRRSHAVDPESTQAGAGTVVLPLPRLAKLGALAMAAAFALAAVLVFTGGGYRGLIALLGVMLVLLSMPASLWLPGVGLRVTALMLGALLGALAGGASWALSMAVPKAAYVNYAVALVVCGLLRWRDKPGQAQPFYVTAVCAAWFWLLASMVIVADYWGGTPARWTSVAALLALGGLWSVQLIDDRFWPLRSTGYRGLRQRALLVAGLVLVMAVVALLGGGAYLRDRAATWKEDGKMRIAHWQAGLRLMHGPEQWLLGKGAGRFVASHFYEGPIQSHIGDYRLRTEGDESFLALTGGKHSLGYGEMFRITQRIEAPSTPTMRVRVLARSGVESDLRFEVCERHLIYIGNCSDRGVHVKPVMPSEGGEPVAVWQPYELELKTPSDLGGSGLLSRAVTFSMAVGTPGVRIDIARVALLDGTGRPLLVNGDFNREMAHWFFSSDKHHLPWHFKNAALHVLFEQGLVGLALLGTAYVLVLVRLSVGRGRDHPLAPAFVAALIGFAVVGAFDSLIDASRIGFLFFLLVLLGLGLRAMPGEGLPRAA